MSGTLRVRYRLQNRSQSEITAVRLFVLLRPFQVTPPWQSFRDVGGVSRMQHLAWDEETLRVDDRTSIVPTSAPTGFGATTFDEGPIAAGLAAGLLPPRDEVQDTFGFASGAFEFALQPRTAADAASGSSNAGPLRRLHRRTKPTFDWIARINAQQWSGTAGAALPWKPRSRPRAISSSPAAALPCSPGRAATRAPGSEMAR